MMIVQKLMPQLIQIYVCLFMQFLKLNDSIALQKYFLICLDTNFFHKNNPNHKKM